MPRRTRDEFKAAFKALKKPSRPKTVPSNLKGDLEKAVKDGKDEEFASKIGELEALDRAYLVGLVAYKLAKHFENQSKKPFWHDQVPSDVLDEALARIVPQDMSDAQTRRMAEQAVSRDETAKLALLYERDPDGTVQYLLDSKEAAVQRRAEARRRASQARERGDESEAVKQDAIVAAENHCESQFNGALAGVLGADSAKLTAKFLIARKTDEATRQLLPLVGFLELDDVREVALAEPVHFIQEVLTGVDTTARVKLLSDPSLRQALGVAAPEAWAALAAQVPMLRLYDTVDQARRGAARDGDPKVAQQQDIAAIFDSLMDGDDVAVAYVGTKTGNPSEMMAALGPANTQDPPRTDCHNMLMVLKITIAGYPGMVPGLGEQLKWGHCKNMLMTKPLSQIGVADRGLINKTFAGNVFDDAGAATGRILFTGENGVNSHSWLEADGYAYDPVLGISGTVAQVRDASVFKTFDWKVDGAVGVSDDGWYFIMDAPEIVKSDKPRLRLAANAMSFNTAYYLTQFPELHLNPEILAKVVGS